MCRRAPLLALLFLMLLGCGQTGPLYLPDEDNGDKTE